MIVQELLKLQNRHGYLPRRELRLLADRLAAPLYRINEVASFFPHFRLFRDDQEEAREIARLPVHEVAVCRDMACRLRGSAEITKQLTEFGAAKTGRLKVCEVACLGRCDRAPAVRVYTHDYGHASNGDQQHGEHAGDHAGHQVRNLFGRGAAEVCNAVERIAAGGDLTSLPDDKDMLLPQLADEWKINVYAGKPAEERYASIRRYLSVLENPPSAPPRPKEPRSEAPKAPAAGGTAPAPPARPREDKPSHPIIAALWTANLLGMGGAGGRAWKKWDEVLRAKGERKYVVCNGDESEPGTFKDRELFLRTPYLVLEGIILAGLLLRAAKGYVYIRHEYEEQIHAMQEEIAQAKKLGVCGKNILGTELSFDVEVFVSPGGYICGEQTALIQAIQDERAEPRNRPPELQTNGLWDMPTLLNNVETFAWIPAIVTAGEGDGQWYSVLGGPKPQPLKENDRPHYQGARFFSISGDVNRPGVYEVPIGITMGELIDKHCGGVKDGRKLKAIATSGPSAGFLPAVIELESFSPRVRQKLLDHKLIAAGATTFALRDLRLELGIVRDLNLMLGGGIVIYAEGTDLVDQALACLRFYQSESCGKCVPCRIGSTKLVELAEDLQAGRLSQAAVDRLLAKVDGLNAGGTVLELAQVMAETAICGLGNVAPNPLRTLLSYFPEDVNKYVRS